MNQKQFISKLEVYQTSDVSIFVKEKAINRLKKEFLNSNIKEKQKQIMYEFALSSAEIKFNEIFK